MNIKLTICQFPEGPEHLPETWHALTQHVTSMGSDLVLLPEMPFSPWLSADESVDGARWMEAVETHRQWLSKLGDLGDALVASSRPVEENGVFYNEGFIWSKAGDYRAVHRKRYLPDEPGFYEARWYASAEKHFKVIDTPLGKIGFLICTELWFTEWARDYARQGARFVLCPRANQGSVEKWLVGGRAVAIMSGAWCLSSNRGGRDERGDTWAGGGWIIEPEDGRVCGLTAASNPFVTLEIDVTAADRAKQTYPRYVKE
ncbi:MAG: carbon-nitrogen hydrolase family protein [Acidobacteriota bacterium]|nr:carbon-nitrogen hydrolase family protein [Acidobacteriota bacterium]